MKLLASSLLSAFLIFSPLNKAEVKLCYKDCKISTYGVSQIAFFEGYSPFKYKDAAGKPTIGHGHLILPGESFKEPLLPEEARNLLIKDIKSKEKAVNHLVATPVKQGQFDALVSFTYNVGSGALKGSTMLKYLNTKKPPIMVAEEFLKWDKITLPNGTRQTVYGLYIRRKSEYNMFLS